MLKPSMNELMKRVGNRYLLVNLAAQRARDISAEAEEKGETLPDKAVKMALDEIAAGTIVYKAGPKAEPVEPIMPRDFGGTLALDFDEEDSEEHHMDMSLDDEQDETEQTEEDE